jgi:hypothetical protein
MEFEIEKDLTSYGLARLGRGGPLYNSAEACYVGQPKADWISTGPSPVVWRACAHTVRSPRLTLARCTTTGDGTMALEAHDRWREREESSARVPGTVVGRGLTELPWCRHDGGRVGSGSVPSQWQHFGGGTPL